MSATLDHGFFGIHEDIILTKDGTWLSNGEEILHENTVRAFSKNIFRCKDGFEIRLGTEHKTIHVEDTIYFVVRLEGSGEIGYNVILNDGRTLELDTHTLQYSPGRLTCRVEHPNDKTHENAKFLSAAYYELLKFVQKAPQGFYIVIEGENILLSRE